MKKILTIAFLMLAISSVHAAGFRVALQSARQLGMGHVGTGMQLGAESVFFNSGALALATHGDISVSGNAVMANTQYNTPGTTYIAELEDNIGTPFAAYGSFKFSDKFGGGLGVYTPYGNVVEWPSDWAGRGISQKVDLSAIFIQPTLSYKISDKVGLGAGFIYTIGDVTLQRGIPAITSTPEPSVTLETSKSASGIGFSTGLYIEPDEGLSLGINYRSKVEVEAKDGKVTTANIPAIASGSFKATSFDATLPLPAELAFGAGWQANDKFTFGADLNYIFWSQYKSLQFNYNDVLGGNTSTVVPQNWEDSWTAKIGTEYHVSEKFYLRGGMYYDFSPIPDETLSPITPDTDRFSLSSGFSFMPSEKWSIDAAFLYVNGRERTVQASESQFNFGQRYKITAMVPSFGFNYSFK